MDEVRLCPACGDPLTEEEVAADYTRCDPCAQLDGAEPLHPYDPMYDVPFWMDRREEA